MEIRLEGMDNLYSQINKLAKKLGDEKVEPLLKNAADKLTDAVKDKAPVDKGILRENIVTLKMEPRYGNPASYMTKVKQRATWPTEAPHAHLVELGTVNAPAHPFFRPAYDSVKDGVYSELIGDLRGLI